MMSALSSDLRSIRFSLPVQCQVLKSKMQIRARVSNQEDQKTREQNKLESQKKQQNSPKINIVRIQRSYLETIKEVPEYMECESYSNSNSCCQHYNYQQINMKMNKEIKQKLNCTAWKFQLQEDEILAVSIISFAIVAYLIFQAAYSFFI